MANDVKRTNTAPKQWSARLTLLLCLGVLAVLVTQLPDPAQIVDTLTGGAPTAADVLGSLATIQSMLLATAGLIAWLLVAWVVAVLVIGLAARLPGGGGRRARRLLPRIAPAAIGRLVATAVGVSIIAGTAACAAPADSGTAATTTTLAPTASVAATDGSITIDWPAPTTEPVPTTTAQTPTAPTPTAPTPPAPTTATVAPPVTTSTPTPAPPDPEPPAAPEPAPPPTAPAAPPEGSVTVQPGDSLWRIAAHTLGPDATDADIDNAWRAWYFTNHEVIGDDPDVIVPGQALVAPAAGAQVRS